MQAPCLSRDPSQGTGAAGRPSQAPRPEKTGLTGGPESVEVTNVWQGVRERGGTRRAVRTRPGRSAATSPGASTVSARPFWAHTLATTGKRTRPQRRVRNASRNPSSAHPTRCHVCTEPGTDLCRDTEDPVPGPRGGRADAGSRNERPTGSTRGQQARSGCLWDREAPLKLLWGHGGLCRLTAE